MGYSTTEIAHILNANEVGTTNDSAVSSLLIDSRKVIDPKNALFFAIAGERHNGHQYIPVLIQKGVTKFVVSEDVEAVEGCLFIKVNDSLKALQTLVKHHRNQFNLPTIGITGSNGKTITKEWIFQLLAEDYTIVRSPKSYNSQVGVPLSVWNLDKEHNLAIFEAGISKPLEMEKLEKIIQPTIGILTNIKEAHQENFHDKAEKLLEKLQLFKNVDSLIFGLEYADLEVVKNKLKPNANLISWSFTDKLATYFLKFTTRNKRASLKVIKTGLTIGDFDLQFTDKASVENAINCILLLLELNYSVSTIQQKLNRLQPVSMRLELKAGANNCTLINDSYNSDLASLEIALDLLNQQHQHETKVLILSDVFGHAYEQEAFYQKVAYLVKRKEVDCFLGVGVQLQKYQGKFNNITTHFYETTDELKAALQHLNFTNCGILVKGSRPFKFENITKQLEQKNHSTVLEINLSALENNLNKYKAIISPGVKIMAMVKAFTYGSGGVEIANLLEYNRVDYLAVAYTDEGVELRKAGVSLPIMVLNPELENMEALVRHNLEPEIYSFRVLNAFVEMLNTSIHTSSLPYSIHLKLDTGMHRLGFVEEDISQLVEQLKETKTVKVASVFSHLVASGKDEFQAFTEQQIANFSQLSARLENELAYSIIKHILNSDGITRFPSAQFNMVRLGIGMHGIGKVKGLEQVATLKTRISQIKTVIAGETVGYNRSGTIAETKRIATVAIGYADGYSRKLGNGKGTMIINGSRASTIGDVCMDMCMLDVTTVNCKEGDEVIVFGTEHPLTRLAKDSGTIPYEVLTGISRRVKRVFVRD